MSRLGYAQIVISLIVLLIPDFVSYPWSFLMFVCAITSSVFCIMGIDERGQARKNDFLCLESFLHQVCALLLCARFAL